MSCFQASIRLTPQRTCPSLVIMGLSLALLPVTAAGRADAKPAAYSRIAVVSTKAAQKTGLGDMVTAMLSRMPSLELLERDALAAVTSELKLSALFGADSTSGRLRLGRILRADVLTLLSLESRDEKQYVRCVIADCPTGVRLQVRMVPYAADARDKIAADLADLVNKTRQRYAGGIKQIYCVTPFVSKNLSHKYDHLQSGYAALLETALLHYPGVAVVEMEEARAIARELALVGDRLKNRIVLRTVAGSYEMSAEFSEAAPTVRVVLRITDGKRVVEQIDEAGLAMHKVAGFLTDKVAPRCVGKGELSGVGAGIDQQYRHLIARADEFSSLGFRDHAAALREAAVLLKPDEHEQRVALVVEYFRKLDSARADRPFYLPKEEASRKRALAERRRNWRSMLYHVERLIRNGRVNPLEADALVYMVTRGSRFLAATGIEPFRKGMPERILKESDEWRQPTPQEVRRELDEYFRLIYPLFPKLDPRVARGALGEPLKDTRSSSHMMELKKCGYRDLRDKPVGKMVQSDHQYVWAQGMVSLVLSATTSPFLTTYTRPYGDVSDGRLYAGQHFDMSRYYDTLGWLLTHVELDAYRVRLPAPPAPVAATNDLGPAGRKLEEVWRKRDEENLRKLAERLTRTGRPDLVFLARRMVIQWEFFWCVHDKSRIEKVGVTPEDRTSLTARLDALLDRVDALASFVRQSGYKSPQPVPVWDPPAELKAFRKTVAHQRFELRPPKPRVAKAKQPHDLPTIPRIRKPSVQTRVQLDPLPLSLEFAGSRLACIGPERRFDILWNRRTGSLRYNKRTVYLMPDGRSYVPFYDLPRWPAEEDTDTPFYRDGDWVETAKFDGKYIWLVARIGGVHLLDMRGRLIGRWCKTNGLPPHDTGQALLQTAGPGQGVMVGRFKQKDKLPRVWLVWLESDGKMVKPVHVLLKAVQPADRTGAANQRFYLAWTALTRDPGHPNRAAVLVGRDKAGTSWRNPVEQLPPLIVDPHAKKVRVCSRTFPVLDHSPGRRELLTTPDGRIHAFTKNGVAVISPPAQGRKRWPVKRVRGEDPKSKQKRDGLVADHYAFRTEDGFIFLDQVGWWRYDPEKVRFTFLASRKDPILGQKKLSYCAHLGVIAMGHLFERRDYKDESRIYRVTFLSAPSVATVPLSRRFPNIPPARRQQEADTIAALRKLGARVLEGVGFCAVEIGEDWRGGQEGLALLTRLHNPSAVHIIKTRVTPAGLRYVEQCPSISKLVLYETSLTDRDLAPLAKLKRLRELHLEGAAGSKEFTDAVFDHIGHLPLKQLTLYGPGFTTLSLGRANAMPTLQKLYLFETSVPESKVIAQKKDPRRRLWVGTVRRPFLRR